MRGTTGAGISLCLGVALLLVAGSCGQPSPPPGSDGEARDPAAPAEPDAPPNKQAATGPDTAPSEPTVERPQPEPREPDGPAGTCSCEPRGSLAPLVAKLQPSVVNIYTSKLRARYNPLAPFFSIPPQVTKERSLGSGFIYSASEGLVVTNYHVVAKAHEVKIRLSDRGELPATFLGGDQDIDLALLRVPPSKSLQEVSIGDSDHLQVGDWVLAIGNPFGLSQTVTSGIVSALSRTIGAGPYDDFIQTDASINPGNSGGPLFDMQGRVVGINTAIHREGQGIGFAIPMSMARPLLDQIRTTGRVVRVHLGVIIQDVTPEMGRALGQTRPTGALVAEVVVGSPAAQAGIRPGDVIVSFNEHDIRVSRNLPTQVARTRPTQTVPIVVLRSGQRVTLQATMAARPAPTPTPGGGLPQWPTYPPPQGRGGVVPPGAVPQQPQGQQPQGGVRNPWGR